MLLIRYYTLKVVILKTEVIYHESFVVQKSRNTFDCSTVHPVAFIWPQLRILDGGGTFYLQGIRSSEPLQ